MDLYMLLDAAPDVEEVKSDTIKEANELLETLEGYIPKIVDFGIKILVALIILAIGKFIIKLIMKFINKLFNKGKIEISVKKFLLSLCKALLYFVLVIILCNQVGIDTTSFIAILGTAGVALGLALQGSLSNFAGGVLILILKPFVVGDYIKDNGSGQEGKVERVDLFYTHIQTFDNKIIIIPNGSLTNCAITNYSTMHKRRIDIDVGISYSSNMSEAKRVLLDVINNNPLVLRDEDNTVVVKELAESQITMGIRAWSKAEDYWTVYFGLTEEAKNALDKAGIEIPYNQLDVHVITK